MTIDCLINYGFLCPNCSDGVPLTEKFMSNLLFSKNIGFIYQATKTNFDWIKNGSRYDFALPSDKVIIEIDGDLRSHGDRENDNYKDEMAKANGWNMIRINLLEENYTGSFKQLWNAYKPVLDNLGIYIADEEAKECYEKSQTSIFHLVVQIANENPEFNQQQIANKLKEKYGYPLTRQTISRYLKKSNELCLTKYENKNRWSKRNVICITTGKIYESCLDAERQTGVANQNISECCHGKRKSAGKDENGNKLVWRYYNESL